MIIVITNRKLPVVPQVSEESIPVKRLTNELGPVINGNRIHTGLLAADAQSILFYPKGRESELYTEIETAELNKPWVFFIHGFHQDPDENITKAVELSRNQDVNVVVFAWPSRPEDHTANWDDAKNTIIKDTLKGTLNQTTLLKIAIGYAQGYLRDYWDNYDPAVKNAEQSDVDLMAAMQQVKNELHPARPIVLLVHSMGNYLLKNALLTEPRIPLTFNNIVLHQADVNARGHHWAQKLTDNLHGTAKLYITTNMYDGVLAASCARRGLLNIPDKERLGQTRHFYELSDAFYLDFTDAPGIEIDHEMFRRKKDETNEFVFKLLGRIFRAELDALPVDDGESSAGFSRMPVAKNLFRLEYINDPIPIESETPDEEQLVRSLDVFRFALADA